MVKCELCRKYDYVRTLNNIKMCVFCYMNNNRKEKDRYITEIKATSWDEENLVNRKKFVKPGKSKDL